MTFRYAASQDAAAVAALHAESWRSAYRGILSEEYLENRAHLERAQVWRQRFVEPREKPMFTLLAEEEEQLVGFACVFPDENAVYGSFLDNLHVAPGFTGKGIGRKLLSEVARHLAQNDSDSTAPGARGLYLWVIEQNVRARGFYEKAGAQVVGLETHLMADGQRLRAIRCYWPDASSLVL